ncbi:hypothetical protein [Spiroplasma platyhelix]|uniref:Uncharacterized protein n=1 Tax=Spiroplasma platyhelix PALS-1 TaxID=1276218 RepID=A0A846TW30_9MOLU|nr:hypothetical protein [Spiroplasma platyhelix]MBE4703818.1 hypothetical protein [Spiroplasma platyhelix PALS-1]NKE38191.1 hypothetical protein [Spiroplasma platyhelix PALS-1]UJB29076.1 hypothetical protein SPLAT_v1c03120 [Spiroplasma platyhelix PALS-1]
MKRILTMIGAAALITSGVSTTVVINSQVQNNIVETNHIGVLKETNIYVSENWKVNAEGPKTLAEKIGGVWRLEFNHELTQDIISGSASVNDILDIVSDVIEKIPSLKEKIGSISDIINVILKLEVHILDKADEGNGILIRFGGWIMPTKLTASTHSWN